MANTTDPIAHHIHGTDPQYLVEKILRTKIRDSQYWKEHCFALTAESLIDKAVELKCVGGTFGGARKPTDFMCLILKMLQIQPEKEIVVAFIMNQDHKYLRIIGAFYLRLIGKPMEIYQYLEPLLNDFRKIRTRDSMGKFHIIHVDEIVDNILRSDYYFDIALPRLPARMTLEITRQLEPRSSALEDMKIMEDAEDNEDSSSSDSEEEKEEKRKSKKSKRSKRSDSPAEAEEEDEAPKKSSKSSRSKRSRRRSRSRSRSRSASSSSSSSPSRSPSPRRRSRKSKSSRRKASRSRSRDRSRDRSVSRSRDRDRDRASRKRRRSRERERRRRSRS